LPPEIGAGSDRTNDHEIVVHDLVALDAKPFGDEFLFRRLVMDEHNVGIAAPPDIERLSGADGNDFHLDPGCRSEPPQDVAEQSGLFGRGGRYHRDRARLRAAGEKTQAEKNRKRT
jgi:hypothetical protein